MLWEKVWVMGKLRYSKHIDITISKTLLKEIDDQADRYKLSRSGLIRWALQEWLEAHPDKAKQAEELGIDPRRPFNDYLKPGMSAQETIDMLERYDAAQGNRLYRL
jgi:Arc/MetJ-type ribon-helix-helix transcriptional regulator